MTVQARFRRSHPATAVGMRVVALDGSGRVGRVVSSGVVAGHWVIRWDERPEFLTSEHWTKIGPASRVNHGRRLLSSCDPECRGDS